MIDNKTKILNWVRADLATNFPEELPTLKDIEDSLEEISSMIAKKYPITEEEYRAIILELETTVPHSMGDEITIYDPKIKQTPWYNAQSGNHFHWNRYKSYLINFKKRMPVIVRKMDLITNKIMDQLGDPKSKNSFQIRGLLMGDVQAGKTEFYTMIINKAIDAGYKVIIVLAGMTNSLRTQTQSRLDAEIIGCDSADLVYDEQTQKSSIKYIGVGRSGIASGEQIVTPLTSTESDFDKDMKRLRGLQLDALKGAALFVVKKNATILNNLLEWLQKDQHAALMPLLLVDDEADNASIDVGKDGSPTAINSCINGIVQTFHKASYLAVTATPFANIFIDPDLNEQGFGKDLFPRNFITLLPSTDSYIGLSKIFGRNADSKYKNLVKTISKNEQKNYFRYGHKKDLEYVLTDLPGSMYEAIRYFVLATAVSDARYQKDTHRTMLINVSRFTKVQNKTAALVNDYIENLRTAVDSYAGLSVQDALSRSPLVKSLKDTWDKFGLQDLIKQENHIVDWKEMQQKFLSPALERIQVRIVNQTKDSKNSTYQVGLDYQNYENSTPKGLRVIAVGGNNLSRGITLEGLIVSYFYRNTAMYDTLTQMGRWFGHREGYSDLMKVWMGGDTLQYFGTISDATEELKEDLRIMSLSNRTPADFGLRVKKNPGSLIVTARNKMRKAKTVTVPINIAGRMIETPRIIADIGVIQKNNQLCSNFIKKLCENGYSYISNIEPNGLIFKDIPRDEIVGLINGYESHALTLSFQAKVLSEYINNHDDLKIWDVAIPFGEGNQESVNGISVKLEKRYMPMTDGMNLLMVGGRHVRIGSGNVSAFGLNQQQISEAKNIIKDRNYYIDKDFLSVKERKPILVLHYLYPQKDKEGRMIIDAPFYRPIFALGLGFPGDRSDEKTATYVLNLVALRQYDLDSDSSEGDVND